MNPRGGLFCPIGIQGGGLFGSGDLIDHLRNELQVIKNAALRYKLCNIFRQFPLKCIEIILEKIGKKKRNINPLNAKPL